MPRLGAAVGPCAADRRVRAFERRAADRARDRRAAGRPAGRGSAASTVLSVETGDRGDARPARSRRAARRLLLSGPRAAALGLANQRDAADADAAGRDRAHCDWLDRDAARALADPGRDFDRGPIGPLGRDAGRRSERCAKAALTLARLAGLLPALWLVEADTDVAVDRPSIDAATAAPVATIVARAKLPLDDLPPSQIVAFRDPATRRGACRAGGRRVRRRAAAGPAAQRMPDRRRVRQPQMRLRAAAQGGAAADRRGRRRRPALSAPGRARHRPRQQAARLCAAGSRARHGRCQPPPRLRRRRARLCAWPRRCCGRWGSTRSGC